MDGSMIGITIWQVPEGHTFKGFPIQFAHVNAKRMMAAFMQVPCDPLQE